MEYRAADEIPDVQINAPHVVILGAGASLAACPTGDLRGHRLPLMTDLSEVLGLDGLLALELRQKDFESIYSELTADPSSEPVHAEIERRVYDYFAALELPPFPTIYDHLVLSLRPKDVIATFNWDPFLVQAVQRSYHVGYQPPRVMFLHGNVAIGHCERDRTLGPVDHACSRCGDPFTPSRLLYPVSEKNYQADPQIAAEWDELQRALKHAFMVTIFGYSAPSSDEGAMQLFRDAWGTWQDRQFEQFEIIDVRPEDELIETWDDFIHTHHYTVETSFYDSHVALHPRRSGEAYHAQFLEARWPEGNPLPRELPRTELWNWLKPLLSAEGEAALVSHYR